jgi:hypothetical protein
MKIDDLEAHLTVSGHQWEHLVAPDNQMYLIIKYIVVPGGSLDGKRCDVGVLRTTEDPWLPQAALHVRPPLVPMGQHNTQASPLGADWQYWSRRFDRVPSPRAFLAHVLTCLARV